MASSLFFQVGAASTLDPSCEQPSFPVTVWTEDFGDEMKVLEASHEGAMITTRKD